MCDTWGHWSYSWLGEVLTHDLANAPSPQKSSPPPLKCICAITSAQISANRALRPPQHVREGPCGPALRPTGPKVVNFMHQSAGAKRPEAMRKTAATTRACTTIVSRLAPPSPRISTAGRDVSLASTRCARRSAAVDAIAFGRESIGKLIVVDQT